MRRGGGIGATASRVLPKFLLSTTIPEPDLLGSQARRQHQVQYDSRQCLHGRASRERLRERWSAAGDGATISLHYLNPYPVADEACVYTLEGKEESGAGIDVQLQQTVDGEIMFTTVLFRK